MARNRKMSRCAPQILIFSLLALLQFSCRKSDYLVDETVPVRDLGSGTGTVTWTSDKSYLLEGFVYVNDGQTLSIEPGTVIRARTGQGTAASALIVARGGRILAEGTADQPIIFTCDGDDLEGSVPLEARGLWGGVILLGDARLNSEFNENSIEGIPFSEPRGVYGGNNDDDDSGILRYMSIRHGGTDIGEDNEINGLTLGGVGRGTVIEHVEVVSNADDGFEFFGGTCNTRYLVSVFCGDDAFDYDEGYRGYGQFWLAIQGSTPSNHLAECSGGIHPENGKPYSLPEIYNATFIGGDQDDLDAVLSFTRNAGGMFANCIFANQASGILVEYKEGLDDSYRQLETGNLQVNNNLFQDVGGADSSGIIRIITDEISDMSARNGFLRSWFISSGNMTGSYGIGSVDGGYRVMANSPLPGDLATYPDEWFDDVGYKGAFGTYDWTTGWSLVSASGLIRK